MNITSTKNLFDEMSSHKLLVVGAGGIGCELLKNLVLSGFKDIEIIDLDTIDISNLNRQFLFRREHVGKSKALIAKESVEKFVTDVNIVAHCDTVMNRSFNVQFFKKFGLVLNALDNRAARSHVNRMCLAAEVPLIESGSAGYLGQVTLIKKGQSECYDCQPKAPQKSYPGCTIRNTPSEPVHCIVWAKHLFNQLFGESDPDEEVSPDTSDPENADLAAVAALRSNQGAGEGADLERKSTRQWATESGYDAQKIFNKLFHEDIKYLLTMGNLWKARRPPDPLVFSDLPDQLASTSSSSSQPDTTLSEQRVNSPLENGELFVICVQKLRDRLRQQGDAPLVWDKDDTVAMQFVASTANLRSFSFGIPLISPFDVKSIAGNIIPAIATTNAVIAGLMVVEAFRVLSKVPMVASHTVYLKQFPNARGQLFVQSPLCPPNPKCYVCAEKPQVDLQLNVNTFTLRSLQDKVLKAELGMIAPDVELDDGKGTILISSDEDDEVDNYEKVMSDFHIETGTILRCDDFLQNYTLHISVQHVDKFDVDDKDEEVEFKIIGTRPVVESEEDARPTNGVSVDTPSRKRKASVENELLNSHKKSRVNQEDVDDEDVLVL